MSLDRSGGSNGDGSHALNYDQVFDQAIDRLHGEGRYRVFIDILRNKGAYPNARCFAGHNGPKPITVWCSNDYLAMGQHPKVIAAMEAALHDVGRSEEHTSELQSPCNIVCRLLLEKKKYKNCNVTVLYQT